jgi:hypothetical protein
MRNFTPARFLASNACRSAQSSKSTQPRDHTSDLLHAHAQRAPCTCVTVQQRKAFDRYHECRYSQARGDRKALGHARRSGQHEGIDIERGSARTIYVGSWNADCNPTCRSRGPRRFPAYRHGSTACEESDGNMRTQDFNDACGCTRADALACRPGTYGREVVGRADARLNQRVRGGNHTRDPKVACEWVRACVHRMRTRTYVSKHARESTSAAQVQAKPRACVTNRTGAGLDSPDLERTDFHDFHVRDDAACLH